MRCCWSWSLQLARCPGRERERLSASEAEVAALQASQADMQSDLDGCHAKEADLLDFTQKLTEKNVELQSQISGFQARVGGELPLQQSER